MPHHLPLHNRATITTPPWPVVRRCIARAVWPALLRTAATACRPCVQANKSFMQGRNLLRQWHQILQHGQQFGIISALSASEQFEQRSQRLHVHLLIAFAQFDHLAILNFSVLVVFLSETSCPSQQRKRAFGFIVLRLQNC